VVTINFYHHVIQLTKNEVSKIPINYLSLGIAERLFSNKKVKPFDLTFEFLSE